MYRDDHGKRVKLDERGKPYPVGQDGFRVGKASGRPMDVTPEQWKILRPILQREGKTYEQFVAEIPKTEKDNVQNAPDTGGPLTAIALAAATPGAQKQMIRGQLLSMISWYQPVTAEKITDTLLKLDNSELLTLMDSKQKLRTKVGEIAGNIENTTVRPEDHSSAHFAMLEIFAGTARVTAACKDIGLITGPPVDINTGFDLLTAEGQQSTWKIIKSGQPLVIFMAPVCTA